MLLGHRSSTSLLAALKHGPRRGRRGMTLIEVMIVIVLILMVMGALAFGLQSMFAQGQGMTAELQMAKINERITIYVARSVRHRLLLQMPTMAQTFPSTHGATTSSTA